MAIITADSVKKNITTSEQTIPILRGVNIEVNEGETISIMGASGSGKTTLLSLLAGLDLPSEGEIIVDGHNMGALNENQRAQHRLGRIGFIFQNFELLTHATAIENVMIPLELANVSNPQLKAQKLLEKVGLENRLHHYPYQLSGGEQQRVAIARAFITDPKIIFADEPTGSLDLDNGEKILNLLFDLNKEKGTTLIFVTHEQKIAERCQKVFILEEGKLKCLSV